MFEIVPQTFHIFSFSASVNVSTSCRTFLPSQFFISAVFSISVMAYDLGNNDYLSCEVFSSLYLSSLSQSNVGGFIIAPIFGPMLCPVLICSLAILLCLIPLNIWFHLPLSDCLALPPCFATTVFWSLPNVCCLHLPI